MKTININVSQVVAAPLDKVWDVVSDVDNDPKYWVQYSDIRNISKDGNKIEREVTVGGEHKARQTIVLNPKKSVELTITQGQIDVRKTRIDVSWNFTPSGVAASAYGMVKSEMSDITKKALQKIADESAANQPATRTLVS